jgi:6-phosphogluconolactonase (cycloisomerase 2 family)
LTKTATSTATSLGFFSVTSPDGRFLFNVGNQMVESLSIGSSGALTLVQSPVPVGGDQAGLAGQVAVSSDSKFLFVLNQGNIGIFNIGDSGLLTPVVGSPFTTEANGAGFSLAPDGRHLYVAFQPGTINSVEGFTFDPVAGTLTPIAGALINDNALTVTVDGSGRFAYVSEAGQLVTYDIDPVSGALTRASQTTKPTSEGPQSVVVVP